MKKFATLVLLLLLFGVSSEGSVLQAMDFSQMQKEMKRLPTKKYAVTINVKAKKYGAKNKKDCTKAFQKALNDAEKKANGKKQARIIIPKGTYYLKGTLLIGSNIYIKAHKKARIIKKSKKFAYMIRSKIGKGGGYSGIHNVLIEGGIWDENFVKYTRDVGGSNMCFVHGNNIVFRNAEFCNNFGTHLIELCGVQNVLIEKCRMHGYQAVDTSIKKEAIQLDVVHPDVISKGYPYDNTPCRNVIIRNNKIYDYARGIGTHTSVDGIYNNTMFIYKNEIYNLWAEALYLFNFIRMRINDNRIWNVGKGILIKSTSEKVVKRKADKSKMVLEDNDYDIGIYRNYINANDSGGAVDTIAGIHVVGEEKRMIRGIDVAWNSVSSASELGIYFRYVLDSIPHDNIVVGEVKINNN